MVELLSPAYLIARVITPTDKHRYNLRSGLFAILAVILDECIANMLLSSSWTCEDMSSMGIVYRC